MEPLTRATAAEPDRTPDPRTDEEVLRVSLLGRFEVSVGSRVFGEEGWQLRKAASLVKLLALAPYHRLHREQAMELLWPDLAPGSALGAADVPVRLSWSATDAEGEVTAYALQRGTDGGPYEDVALAGATATTGTFRLEPGHDHRFRVRATDDNGNRSACKYGPRFALDAPQENDPPVSYARTWKTQTLAGASGGGVRYATAKGAKATLSFTGSEVAWVAPKSKTRGKAAVYLDGARVATVDLFSNATLARQVVFSKSNLDPATPHTLEVKNLGTAGRSRVDVDAFVIMR